MPVGGYIWWHSSSLYLKAFDKKSDAKCQRRDGSYGTGAVIRCGKRGRSSRCETRDRWWAELGLLLSLEGTLGVQRSGWPRSEGHQHAPHSVPLIHTTPGSLERPRCHSSREVSVEGEGGGSGSIPVAGELTALKGEGLGSEAPWGRACRPPHPPQLPFGTCCHMLSQCGERGGFWTLSAVPSTSSVQKGLGPCLLPRETFLTSSKTIK